MVYKMSQHPFESLLESTMENLKQMIDVNTIVGKPVTADNGTVVIPVSKVSFGLATGGSEFPSKNSDGTNPFAGGIGAGVTINPVAFLVANSENINLLPVDESDDAISKLLDYVPGIVNKIADLIPKKKDITEE